MHRTWKGRPREGERGMTLTEIMIVVVIIGILAALSYPTISGALAANQSRAAMNEVAFFLSEARARATGRNLAVEVYVTFSPGAAGGLLELRESSDRSCTNVNVADPTSGPTAPVQPFDLLKYDSVGLDHGAVNSTPCGANLDLCFKPDGSVFDRSNGLPIPGPVDLYLRRYEGGSAAGVDRIVRLGFNGIPRIYR